MIVFSLLTCAVALCSVQALPPPSSTPIITSPPTKKLLLTLTEFTPKLVVLPKPNVLECGISGLIFAAGAQLESLGLEEEPFLAQDPPVLVRFERLNILLQLSKGGGKALFLMKWGISQVFVFIEV